MAEPLNLERSLVWAPPWDVWGGGEESERADEAPLLPLLIPLAGELPLLPNAERLRSR